MLSFATEFPVDANDPEALVESVVEWLDGSPHSSLDISDLSNIPDNGHWYSPDGRERLECIQTEQASGKICAFRHSLKTSDLHWITSIVFNQNNGDPRIGVRTSRESKYATVSLPSAKKPFIIRTLLSRLKGGLDGELRVSDKAIILKNNDLNMMERLLNGDSPTVLPIVYVSADFSDSHSVSYEPLGKHLGGMAHVVVEPSRSFSLALQPLVNSQNVYGGHVGIYWPNGLRYQYFQNERTQTDFEIRRAIYNDLRSALVNRAPLSGCTWTHAEAVLARQTVEKLKASGSNDVEAYASAFDIELNAKDEEINATREQVESLEAKIRFLEGQGSSQKMKISSVKEKEFFQGEFNNILRDALDAQLKNLQPDMRRYHVIEDFISSLGDVNELNQKRSQIKSILHDYKSMKPKIKPVYPLEPPCCTDA